MMYYVCPPVKVADKFHREMRMRLRHQLEPQFVVELKELVNDPVEPCIVMELGDRSLREIMAKEDLCGSNLEICTLVLRMLARCIGHLHSKGIVHTEITPSNILRCGADTKLLDFDSACIVGNPTTAAHSTAYCCPPELGKRLFRPHGTAAELRAKIAALEFVLKVGARVEHPERGLGTVEEIDMDDARQKPCRVVYDSGEVHQYSRESAIKLRHAVADEARRRSEQRAVELAQDAALLQELEGAGVGKYTTSLESAEPSFDIWAFGTVAYHLCTGSVLFKGNKHDEIVDAAEQRRLRQWSEIDASVLAASMFRMASSNEVCADMR